MMEGVSDVLGTISLVSFGLALFILIVIVILAVILRRDGSNNQPDKEGGIMEKKDFPKPKTQPPIVMDLSPNRFSYGIIMIPIFTILIILILVILGKL